MRPLELYLEGFRSHKDPVTFTFDGRTLFGIVGPTGAGKSSILEALIFALYGKTPRFERDTKKLINSFLSEARVRLTFETGGHVWEVLRVLRQKGSSQVVMTRTDGGSDQVTGERAVNDHVIDVVGLDFHAFCAAVSLPQGDFDRFLRATPSERSKILKGIFRLERVDHLRELARRDDGIAKAELLSLEAQLQSLPEDALERASEMESELTEAQARVSEIRDAMKPVEEAEIILRDSARAKNELEERRSRLDEAVRLVPPIDVLEQAASAEDAAHRAHAKAEKSFRTASASLEKARAEAARISEELGGEEWLTKMRTLIAERSRLGAEKESLAQELVEAKTEFDAAQSEAGSVNKRLKAAENAVESAAQVLLDLHRRHAANLLRGALKEGDPCPVCEQAVGSVPAVKKEPAIARAEAEKKAREKELSAARLEADAAGRRVAQLEERATGLEKRGGTLAAQFAEVAEAIALIFDGPDPAAELTRREAALKDVVTGVEKALHEADLAGRQEREARTTLEESQRERVKFASAVTRVCARLGLDSLPEEEEASGLVGAAKRALDEVDSALKKIATETDDLQRKAADAEQVVASFRKRFAVEEGQIVADVLVAATNRVSDLSRSIADLRAAAEKRAEIASSVTALKKRKALYERLVADLSDSKFTAYLLDEQRRVLARIASEKLYELTGHYRFDDDGTFNVVDTHSGITRTPDTLSGGESFLASLALALGLAEAVAQGGGAISCFFLDEGFGSLDRESLDLALEGIESIAVPGRLIGLISHVPGIQSRLDDLIVLDRAPDGSTIVEQHEGPLGYSAAPI